MSSPGTEEFAALLVALCVGFGVLALVVWMAG